MNNTEASQIQPYKKFLVVPEKKNFNPQGFYIDIRPEEFDDQVMAEAAALEISLRTGFGAYVFQMVSRTNMNPQIERI